MKNSCYNKHNHILKCFDLYRFIKRNITCYHYTEKQKIKIEAYQHFLYTSGKPDLFILATKFDLVRNKSLHYPDATDAFEESLEKFENVEKRLSEELHISERSFRWISFHDGLNTDSEYVENLALKFLKCILQPGTPCTPQPDGIGLMQKANLKAFKIKQRLKQILSQDIQLTFTRANFLAALVGLLIAIILALWFVK